MQLGWTRWELGRKQLVIGPRLLGPDLRRLGLGLRLEAIDLRLLEPGLRQLGFDLRRLVLGPRLAELDPIQLATDCLSEGAGWK